MDSQFQDIKLVLDLYFSVSRREIRKDVVGILEKILKSNRGEDYFGGIKFMLELFYEGGIFSSESPEKIDFLFFILHQNILFHRFYKECLVRDNFILANFIFDVVNPPICFSDLFIEGDYYTLKWLYKVKNVKYTGDRIITNKYMSEKMKKFIRKHLENWKKDIFPPVNIKHAIQK